MAGRSGANGTRAHARTYQCGKEWYQTGFINSTVQRGPEYTRSIAHGRVERRANDPYVKRRVGIGETMDMLQVAESGNA